MSAHRQSNQKGEARDAKALRPARASALAPALDLDGFALGTRDAPGAALCRSRFRCGATRGLIRGLVRRLLRRLRRLLPGRGIRLSLTGFRLAVLALLILSLCIRILRILGRIV